jgi:hypothetical protein
MVRRSGAPHAIDAEKRLSIQYQRTVTLAESLRHDVFIPSNGGRRAVVLGSAGRISGGSSTIVFSHGRHINIEI